MAYETGRVVTYNREQIEMQLDYLCDEQRQMKADRLMLDWHIANTTEAIRDLEKTLDSLPAEGSES